MTTVDCICEACAILAWKKVSTPAPDRCALLTMAHTECFCQIFERRAVGLSFLLGAAQPARAAGLTWVSQTEEVLRALELFKKLRQRMSFRSLKASQSSPLGSVWRLSKLADRTDRYKVATPTRAQTTDV